MVELTHGIPASICLAQALLETDAGRSKLNIIAHNHFGIKAGRYWRGHTIPKIDDKIDSTGTLVPSNFRVYKSDAASFHDYGKLLSRTQRYKSLKRINKADYKAWAYGIYQKGYASNPDYAKLVINLIERYQLDAIKPMEAQTYTAYTSTRQESTFVRTEASLLPYVFQATIPKSYFDSRYMFLLVGFCVLSLVVYEARVLYQELFWERQLSF